MVGGTTYEEARTVHLVNATQTGTRIFLGGTIVQNSGRLVAFLTRVLHKLFCSSDALLDMREVLIYAAVLHLSCLIRICNQVQSCWTLIV